jgi:hypothetical protein
VPYGAFILYNGNAWDADYDWYRHERRYQGSVPRVIVQIVQSMRRGTDRRRQTNRPPVFWRAVCYVFCAAITSWWTTMLPPPNVGVGSASSAASTGSVSPRVTVVFSQILIRNCQAIIDVYERRNL